MESVEVVIIGGGLAGLTAAIHLTKAQISVTLIEKNEYPRHKVCGEYISNEVIPYFNWLDIRLDELKATSIGILNFSGTDGKEITTVLPLGGFGISRYSLDHNLYQKAVANGCKVINATVTDIYFEKDNFTITTSEGAQLKSGIVLGAFGKRSNIDQKMQRRFITQKSPWLAVKAHYRGKFPNDTVGLHNFKGGYCGVSKVENDAVNICYLANYDTFKNHKSIEAYQKEVLSKNPKLKELFDNMTLLFEKPLSISQISFEKKKPVEDHILMIGDTTGLIHPLCGNGMAMAIHSAKIASELIVKYKNEASSSRLTLEQNYSKEWNYKFARRISSGRMLAALLQKPKLSEVALRILITFPFLLPLIVNRTHGKPITIQ